MKICVKIVWMFFMLNASVFKSSFNRPNLYYEVRPKTANVDKDIIKYIRSQSGKSGIIYCLSRKKVEELSETLRMNGISVLPYHAGMETLGTQKFRHSGQVAARPE